MSKLTYDMIERACDGFDPGWRRNDMSLWAQMQNGLRAMLSYTGPWIEEELL